MDNEHAVISDDEQTYPDGAVSEFLGREFPRYRAAVWAVAVSRISLVAIVVALLILSAKNETLVSGSIGVLFGLYCFVEVGVASGAHQRMSHRLRNAGVMVERHP